MDQGQRKLVAILAGDVAGYSRLMAADETGTLVKLRSIRSEIIDPRAAAFRGKVVGSAGDSVLIEFASAAEAVRCAIEMQELIASRNGGLPESQRMLFRMGINLSDVIADQGTIHGDGVNTAARLEKLAEPGGICISRSVYDQVKGKLDVSFSDMGEVPCHNIPDPVHAFRLAPRLPQARRDDASSRSMRQATTSVAVLPFVDMSPSQDQGYFADGVTEDLITELARIRHLSVASRTSTFTYKGRSIKAQEIGRELNADFVIEGSIRQIGPNVRVTVQLIDTHTGAHAWAERFDRAFDDIFAVQDEIVLAIVARLHFGLEDAAALQRQRDPTVSATAYTHFLRALAAWRGGDERAAADQLREAVRLDPNYARALAQLGFHHAYSLFSASLEVPDAEAEGLARECARRALAADNSDPQTLRMVAITYCCLGEPKTAKKYIEAAAAESPRDIDVMLNRGIILVLNGQHGDGLALLELVNRSEPRLPPGYRVRNQRWPLSQPGL
jgi:TolB-like protein